jgi:ADP-heptose:LPS heptosyltransferase
LVAASPATWIKRLMKNPFALLQRHAQACWYVLTVVVPIILRTGKRPVIFSRFAGMGDIINSFPAALELKKKHIGAPFIYNCDTISACLPRMGGVTNLVTSSRQIELVGHWYCPILAGFYRFASDDDDLTKDDTLNSIVAFGQNQGVEIGETHPQLFVSEDAKQTARKAMGQLSSVIAPLIVIHAGPSSRVRQWPREHWMALIQKLHLLGYKKILQIGARAGSYASADKAENAPLPGAFSLVEQLSLDQSIALISLADLYVGIDSGLLHAAASVRTPAVSIWGPTSPQFRLSAEERKFSVTSTVECQGCHHRMPRLHWENGCPQDILCMRTLDADTVLQACLKILAPKIKTT